MRLFKNISLYAAGAIASILAIYLALLLLLPRVINFETVKKEIRNQFSQMVGGQISFKRLELFVWPYPHVAIQDLKISVPPHLNSAVPTSKIYPKILPLLTGKVKIAVVRFDSPIFDLKLMDKSTQKEAPSEPFEYVDLIRRFAATLAILPEYTLPDLKFEIKNGYFHLLDANQKVFELREVQADFRGLLDDRRLKLKCRSNLWEDITINARIDVPALESSGWIHLQGLEPQKLSAYLFPNSAWQITSSRFDVGIDFATDLPQLFKAEITGSLPYLRLQRGNDDLLIKGHSFKAGIEIDKHRVTLSVKDLVMDHPQFKMSAHMKSTSKDSALSLLLTGRHIDVESMRSVLPTLLKENSDINDLFEIMKGGKIPLVIAEARGKTLSDLSNPDNLTIQIQMLAGQISIPGIDLGLEEVSGDAVISGGILKGTQLSARLGNVVGQNGKLRLGLTNSSDVFQIEIGVQAADLSQLPPLLKDLVDDENFRKELSMISALNGSATGILRLGDTTEDINIRVNVDKINLTARYQRVPYPITISDGKVTYDKNQILVEQLQGKVGESIFSQLSAAAYWGREPYLTVKSGNCRLFLAEIHNWLAKAKTISGRLDDIESLNGVLDITTLRLQGPLFRPAAWMIELKGEPTNLAVKTRGSPGVIKATGGSFHAVDHEDARKLYLKDHSITVLDTSFKVSGTVDGYVNGIDRVDLAFEGNMSAQGVNWISGIININLPSEFKLRSPLLISNARLTWKEREKITFSGDLAVRDGPKLTADLQVEHEKLNIKKLLIQDNRSHAAIGLIVEKGKIYLSFNGNLHRFTLDKLVADNQILHGWIRGNFRTRIHLDHTLESVAEGEFQVKDLFVPGILPSSVKIKSLSMMAAHNRLEINSSEIACNDSQIQLSGKVDFASRGMLVDIVASVDELNWNKWEKTFAQREPVNPEEQSKKIGSLPILGRFKIKAERFQYEQFTWSPWHADVSFNNIATNVNVTKAKLCGISTPAYLKISPQELRLQAKVNAKHQKLDPALICLFGETYLVDGRFNLKGEINALGKVNDPIGSLGGNLEFKSEDGHIYRDPALTKTLALLNITEVFLGRIPDFTKEGMSYKSMSFTAKLQQGKIIFKKIYLDSPAMKVTGQGTLDILTQKINFNIIVAPLRIVDRILGVVPLVGGVLQTILTVPVKVEGDLKDPKVTLMDPSVVGSELADLMQDTIQNPIKLIYPGHK